MDREADTLTRPAHLKIASVVTCFYLTISAQHFSFKIMSQQQTPVYQRVFFDWSSLGYINQYLRTEIADIVYLARGCSPAHANRKWLIFHQKHQLITVVSDKMISFRTALTTGVLNLSQISKADRKDTFFITQTTSFALYSNAFLLSSSRDKNHG